MSQKKKSAFDYAMEIAEEYSYFYSAESGAVASVDGRMIPVLSEEFEELIRYRLYTENKISLGSEILKTVISTMAAKARFESEKINIFRRCGHYKGKFYYYIGDGQYVKITSKKYELVDTVPIYFLQSNTMRVQDVPKKKKGIDLWKLKKYFNTKNEGDFILLLITIISYFIEEIPHFITCIMGNQGSAKSTTCRLIKELVDPSIAPILNLPKSIDELILQLANEHVIVYDNLCSIKQEFCNVFCQVSTGATALRRKLFTDNQLLSYSLKKCLVLNGINYVSMQSDLLDRALVITLKPISSKKRKTEKEIFDEFKEEKPYYLNCIFEVLAKAKKIYKTLEIEELPRMADSCKWGAAIAEALDVGVDRYLELYLKNYQQINQEILLGNPTACAIIRLMEENHKWEGSVGELYDELCSIADEHNINQNDRLWAKSDSALSRRLNQLKINLSNIGIEFDIQPICNKRKKISCKKIILRKKQED